VIDIQLALREGADADFAQLRESLRTLTQDAAVGMPPRLQHSELTRREVEVLMLVGRGWSDPQIAEALFISPKTAAAHVANIKGKLGVQSRLEVALKARELGLKVA
jgi:DNA-binding NarL/FixJ family response regulator